MSSNGTGRMAGPMSMSSSRHKDISTGVLQGVVTEFRAGTIRTVGNNWFADRLLRSQMILGTGDIIRTGDFNDDAWLNQIHFDKRPPVVQKGNVWPAPRISCSTPTTAFPCASIRATTTRECRKGVSSLGNGFPVGRRLFLDQLLAYQFTSSNNFWSRPDHISVGNGDATLKPTP